MAEIWFTVTEKFGPEKGEAWREYMEWIQRPQLAECITLDVTHRVIGQLRDEDWKHNVQANYLTHFFRDLDYVLQRFAKDPQGINILAACMEPPTEARALFDDPRFEFQGYDLMGFGDISAITNCVGYDMAFQASDVSPVNLFDEYDFARQVQERLREQYPNDEHADCDLWALWRMRER